MPSALVVVARDHPAFAGHFPGQPLLPGVSLLAEVIEAIRAAPETEPEVLAAAGGSVPVVKFLHPVRPGDALRIEWGLRGAARVGFEVWVRPGGQGLGDGALEPAAEVLAASGQLEVRP